MNNRFFRLNGNNKTRALSETKADRVLVWSRKSHSVKPDTHKLINETNIVTPSKSNAGDDH